ncbi:MAG: hypothetical protein AAF485_18160 [Chloroflexota bacterium]
MNPGESLEGQGQLLQHGRLIAWVDYHLTMPTDTHFTINPTGNFNLDYDKHLGGFVLLKPDDADKITVSETYTLELVNKHRRTIVIERRYKKIKHQGEPRISFWVKVT